MTFDLDRALEEGCRTRDGRPVRIICTDAQGSLPVVALVKSGAVEQVTRCTECGTNPGADMIDLVNLPESHEVTVQLCQTSGGLALLVSAADEIGHLLFEEYANGDAFKPISKPVTVRIDES